MTDNANVAKFGVFLAGLILLGGVFLATRASSPADDGLLTTPESAQVPAAEPLYPLASTPPAGAGSAGKPGAHQQRPPRKGKPVVRTPSDNKPRVTRTFTLVLNSGEVLEGQPSERSAQQVVFTYRDPRSGKLRVRAFARDQIRSLRPNEYRLVREGPINPQTRVEGSPAQYNPTPDAPATVRLELTDGRTLVGLVVANRPKTVLFSWLDKAGKRITRSIPRSKIRKLIQLPR